MSLLTVVTVINGSKGEKKREKKNQKHLFTVLSVVKCSRAFVRACWGATMKAVLGVFCLSVHTLPFHSQCNTPVVSFSHSPVEVEVPQVFGRFL